MTKKKDPKDLLPAGRPSKYSEETAISICAHIGMGNSLTRVCDMKGHPSVASVYTWFKKYPTFLEDYTRAKSDSADADADRIEQIAEGVLTDEYDPASARVAIDAYKWSAGKKRPKKYGDKQQIEHSGEIGLLDLTDQELQDKLDELESDDD